MNTSKVERTVRDLQVGDQLSSGLVVIQRPVRGLSTPQGKCEVQTRRIANGVSGWHVWNLNTRMLVIPHPCFVDKGDPAGDLYRAGTGTQLPLDRLVWE
jgi:hypothetical protein